ncbi:putative membrane protein [Corynebacterium uterequi]|uniref:Fluoride-specific ion channel FluC n=2 Tax=Corynebacterium uterequi TaxID=1072256 RepID=A0A0G3HGB1_9CORY|nr:putative membrane protein [Corynebacterium uterequi]
MGAALGALARWLVGLALGGALATTLLINVVGCVAIGYVRPGPFWGTGVLGGFTSMSTFAVLTGSLGILPGIGYAALTAFGCLGGVILGRSLPRGTR